MTDSVNGSSQASIVLARLDGFAVMPVALQAERGAQLDALLAGMMSTPRSAEPLVLDVPGTIALVFADDPVAALDAALRLEAEQRGLELRIGINYGPVRIVEDAAGKSEVLGDGLSAASAIADFAAAGRILVARAFRDALEEVDADRAARLSAAGIFTDEQVRAHELFAIDPHADSSRRRRMLVAGTLGVATILAAGYAARLALNSAAKPALPGVIVLDIKPHGDVLVDGILKGRSPPLTELEVPAGHHLIEVRYGKMVPLKLDVTLGAGERMTVTHKFAAPTKRTGVIEDLRRRLGL